MIFVFQRRFQPNPPPSIIPIELWQYIYIYIYIDQKRFDKAKYSKSLKKSMFDQKNASFNYKNYAVLKVVTD